MCKVASLKACPKPQCSRTAPVPATKQQADVLHELPMSWGRGRDDGAREGSEHHLCFLLARALPAPAPGRGIGSMPVPNPSTASPHPF